MRVPYIMDMKRRAFLTKFKSYATLAGVSVASATAAVNMRGREVAVAGAANVEEELKRLTEAYDQLDRRTQIIIRVGLAFAGLDLFIF